MSILALLKDLPETAAITLERGKDKPGEGIKVILTYPLGGTEPADFRIYEHKTDLSGALIGQALKELMDKHNEWNDDEH